VKEPSSVRDWPAIFADDEILTTAILDRLLHHVHILTIDGRSHRLRQLDSLLAASTEPVALHPRLEVQPPPTTANGVRQCACSRTAGLWVYLHTDWSEDDEAHDPVVVHLDVKNAPLGVDDYPARLDAYLRTHFCWRRLFRPRHLLTGRKDLVASAMASGWPSVAELRRKFILCLTGKEDVKKRYAVTMHAVRLCFSDAQIGVGPSFWTPSLSKGDRIFMNLVAPSVRRDRAVCAAGVALTPWGTSCKVIDTRCC
jgi:hypothetical protein